MDKQAQPPERHVVEKLDPNPQVTCSDVQESIPETPVPELKQEIIETATVPLKRKRGRPKKNSEIATPKKSDCPKKEHSEVTVIKAKRKGHPKLDLNKKNRITSYGEEIVDRKITTKLPAGFEICHRSDSIWAIVAEALAKESKFEKAVEMLKFLDPKNEKQAQKIMSMVLVEKKKLEHLILHHDRWKKRGENKINNLKKKAENGDKKAIAKLADPKLVKNDIWIGDISKAISTCLHIDKDKFNEFGLEISQFPHRAKSDAPIYFVLSPFSGKSKIEQAYKTISETEQ